MDRIRRGRRSLKVVPAASVEVTLRVDTEADCDNRDSRSLPGRWRASLTSRCGWCRGHDAVSRWKAWTWTSNVAQPARQFAPWTVREGW